jgi:hypothetical protein
VLETRRCDNQKLSDFAKMGLVVHGSNPRRPANKNLFFVRASRKCLVALPSGTQSHSPIFVSGFAMSKWEMGTNLVRVEISRPAATGTKVSVRRFLFCRC